jgi:enoyl reductase
MPRIVQFAEFGPASVLEIVEVAEPHAAQDQVRVAVQSLGLNPIDSKVRGGHVQDYIPIRPPSGLGNEFAGVIDEVGTGVSGLHVGDAVFGTAPFRALAEYLVVEPGDLVPKPAEISWDVAAVLPVAGATGYNSVTSLRIGPQDTVLVSAAAGGVGSVAAQLAVRAGATVIGTASEHNHNYLRSLGVLPSTYGPGLVDRIRLIAPAGITAALENNGTEAIEAALELGVAPARINTVVGTAARYGIGGVGGSSGPETLTTVAGLIASAALSIPIEATYAFDDVIAAYERLDTGHLRGKIVLRVRH